MTAALPVVHPLCRDAVDDERFCRFAQTCHDNRQALQNKHLLRGIDCCWFAMMVDGAPLVSERDAIQAEGDGHG